MWRWANAVIFVEVGVVEELFAKYRKARASWRRKSQTTRLFFWAGAVFWRFLLFILMDFEVVKAA